MHTHTYTQPTTAAPQGPLARLARAAHRAARRGPAARPPPGGFAVPSRTGLIGIFRGTLLVAPHYKLRYPCLALLI